MLSDYPGVDLDFQKGGHSQTYHHVDMGLTGICTVIVCEAHGHEKHAKTGGLGAYPPGNFEKLRSEIESEGIFSDWSPFNAPVNTGTQNFLKCSYYLLHACIHASCKLFQKVNFMLLRTCYSY